MTVQLLNGILFLLLLNSILVHLSITYVSCTEKIACNNLLTVFMLFYTFSFKASIGSLKEVVTVTGEIIALKQFIQWSLHCSKYQ